MNRIGLMLFNKMEKAKELVKRKQKSSSEKYMSFVRENIATVMYIYMFGVQTRINQKKNVKTFNSENLYKQFNTLIKAGKMKFKQAIEIMKNQFGFQLNSKPSTLITSQGKNACDNEFFFYKIKHGFSRMNSVEIKHRPLSVIDLDTRHCFVLSAE